MQTTPNAQALLWPLPNNAFFFRAMRAHGSIPMKTWRSCFRTTSKPYGARWPRCLASTDQLRRTAQFDKPTVETTDSVRVTKSAVAAAQKARPERTQINQDRADRARTLYARASAAHGRGDAARRRQGVQALRLDRRGPGIAQFLCWRSVLGHTDSRAGFSCACDSKRLSYCLVPPVAAALISVAIELRV